LNLRADRVTDQIIMAPGGRRSKPLRRRAKTKRGPVWYLDVYFGAGVALLALAIWAFSTLVEDVLDRDAFVRWDASTWQPAP
jgi:hypothetical protein